jgi:DHA1 family bicyclomycin/chloramphenicol resistance-like MFS transporter
MPPSIRKHQPPPWLLVLITISGTLAMHMFVPALPSAAHDFGASMASMQTTISVYIAGLAIGQLIYGPLSDGVGRRPMLLTGLSLYMIGGLAAAFAFSLHTLIAARLVQALGGCAGLALGRAIVRDGTAGDDALKKLALMNLMMMVGPGLAPSLGAALASTLGWRSIFLLLAMVGAFTLAFTWRLLPETGRPTGKISASALLFDYVRLLRSPAFVGFSLGGGLATTSIYAFIAAAPFIIAGQLHRPSHEVGLYLGLLIVGMSLGNALTSRLVKVVTIERLLLAGNAISVVSAISFLGAVLARDLSIASAITLMTFYCLGAGIASPAALTKAISVNPALVGSAAGLYGFTQMAVGALCTTLVGIGDNPSLSAAVVLAAAASLGQAAFWTALVRRRFITVSL